MKKTIINTPNDIHKYITHFNIPVHIHKTTKSIINNTKNNGDNALLKYTHQFDKVKLKKSELRIQFNILKNSWDSIPSEIKKSFNTVKNNIEQFHQKQMPESYTIKTANGIIKQKYIALEKAGIYIPGGRFPLVSSIFMNAIPAKIAGVKELIMCTPPEKNKKISKYMLAAAYICGIKNVFRIGGAQAIGALAYGTETVPKTDIITGPGNIYVTCAKKIVYGDVNIDILAGPSEIAILCDHTADIEDISNDLLSQLEHDPMSKAFLITTSKRIFNNISTHLKQSINDSHSDIIRKSKKEALHIIYTKRLNTAIKIINFLASEHVEILTKKPILVAEKIKNAGVILAGPYTPVPLSDFACGTNHILPTFGTARSFAGLSVHNFLKPVPIVKYTKKGLKNIAPVIKHFTEIEGLPAHWKSIESRVS